MNPRRKKIFTALSVTGGCVLIAGLFSFFNLSQQWEHQVQDILYRDFQTEQHPDETVIIAIDQNSLNHFEKNYQTLWPFPRDIYAAVTEYLRLCGARAILFDVIFSSPDIDRVNIAAEAADSAFALQMQIAGNVILATQMEDSTRTALEAQPERYTRRFEYSVPEHLIRSYPSITLPIARFQNVAAHPGAVNFFTDDDGICRQIPLLFRHKDRIYPYMALAASMICENQDSVGFDQEKGTLTVGRRRIPLDRKGFFNIYWYGAGGPGNTFHYVSIAQVIQSYIQMKSGQTPLIQPEVFKNRAVFIGATAAGLLDLKPTPFSSLEPYPGVEVYATIYSNIMRGEYIRFFPNLIWMVILAGMIFLLTFAWQRVKIWQSALISVIILIVPLIIAVWAFRAHCTFFPVVSTEFGLVLSVITILLINYFTEGREKKLIKKVFNRYLHPAVVDNLTKNPEKLEMGGKEIVATVMFSDLQGFTGISELFTPPEIVQFLNQYFTRVEQIIFESNGMLDKYTGDGIMAIFGAPLETQQHAEMACRAALGFKKLSQFAIETKGQKIPLITRLGINSGNFVVGNIGSANRMDYTAIGDTVNLSARLEGVNKLYGTQNIISESTYAFVKDQFICRELDYIRVKGRDKPLTIYNVVCLPEEITPAVEDFLKRHTAALGQYRERAFTKAGEAFQQISEHFPEDPVARVFARRCQQLLTNPELIDEEGVFNITVK